MSNVFVAIVVLLATSVSCFRIRIIGSGSPRNHAKITTIDTRIRQTALSLCPTAIIEGSDTGTGTILLSNKACRTKIGIFDVIAEELEVSHSNIENLPITEKNVIRLIDVGSGWGNGAHPTTKLCMNFIMKTIKEGDNLLDYGTGSGILSIAAAKLGAKHCVAVDIDEDTLIAAEMNGRINGVSDILDVVHTR